MRITNNSIEGIVVIDEENGWRMLAGLTSLYSHDKKLTLEINYSPCSIEIAEEPEEVNPSGQRAEG
jgi:hypothetical protein